MGVETEAPFDILRFHWLALSNEDGLSRGSTNRIKKETGLKWSGKSYVAYCNYSFTDGGKKRQNKENKVCVGGGGVNKKKIQRKINIV